MKIERDIKEKEAAAHLALVEEKAKRVDQLERQMALLEMDKDRLKAELGKLNDEMKQKLKSQSAVTGSTKYGAHQLSMS